MFLKQPINHKDILAYHMIVNFMNGIEIKLDKERKPVVCASKDIKKGTLIIAERPLARATSNKRDPAEALHQLE